MRPNDCAAPPAALKPLGVHTPPVRIFSHSPSGVRSGAAGITKDSGSMEMVAMALPERCFAVDRQVEKGSQGACEQQVHAVEAMPAYWSKA
eukprot:1160235-Pelagomonas_calceolata.AAC.7